LTFFVFAEALEDEEKKEKGKEKAVTKKRTKATIAMAEWAKRTRRAASRRTAGSTAPSWRTSIEGIARNTTNIPFANIPPTRGEMISNQFQPSTKRKGRQSTCIPKVKMEEAEKEVEKARRIPRRASAA